MVRASKTMRLTGLNRLVKALVQSRYERGARISRASSSLFSSASSLSVRHSTVSHYSCCMVVAASPLTRRGRYLTSWWSIVASGVLSGGCKWMRKRKSAMISGTSSEGDPASFSEDGSSVFFMKNFP